MFSDNINTKLTTVGTVKHVQPCIEGFTTICIWAGFCMVYSGVLLLSGVSLLCDNCRWIEQKLLSLFLSVHSLYSVRT